MTQNFEEKMIVPTLVKRTIHNFSSYLLTREEQIALSYGLEKYIPDSTNKSLICTKFEHIYQNLLNNIKDLLEANRCRIKMKMRKTCEKYSEIKVPYKDRERIRNLSNNQNIVIMKQDKGRGAVIMDRKKILQYILSTVKSIKLNQDAKATTERKVKQILQKIKQKLTKEIYQKL